MKAQFAPYDVRGWRARVPTKTGRGFWWVTVIEQIPAQKDRDSGFAVIKVIGGKSAGRAWWILRRKATDFVKPRKGAE